MEELLLILLGAFIGWIVTTAIHKRGKAPKKNPSGGGGTPYYPDAEDEKEKLINEEGIPLPRNRD